MFGQKKKNTFRPMLESLDGRELMSVSTITNVIPDSAAIMASAKWDEAADIRSAIAADKDNTVSEANRYAQQNINLSTNNPVIKQGMISFETMPRKDRPSWGEYCGLNHRDVDLYKFTVNAGDRVSFAFNTWEQKMPWTEYKNGKPNTVTKTFSLGLNAQIFDPNKNAGNDFNLEGRISVSHNDNTKTTVLEHTFHKAGTYYLGVSSYWHKGYDIFSGKEGGRNNLSSPIGPYKITASVKKDLVDMKVIDFSYNQNSSNRTINVNGAIVPIVYDYNLPVTVRGQTRFPESGKLVLNYEINQENYPDRIRPKGMSHDIALYWTNEKGENLGRIISPTLEAYNKNSQINSSQKWIGTLNIPVSELGGTPENATGFKIELNSNKIIPELNKENNFKELKFGWEIALNPNNRTIEDAIIVHEKTHVELLLQGITDVNMQEAEAYFRGAQYSKQRFRETGNSDYDHYANESRNQYYIYMLKLGWSYISPW